MTEERLFTPGPTPLPPSVREILARPALHHRSAEFQTVLARATAGLMRLFGTRQPVLTLTGSGTAGMEALFSNLARPGEPVAVLHAGKFGERWRSIARGYGVPVVERNIQDKADNTTRFFVIGRKPSGPVGGGKDISSFLVSLGDEAASHSGALLKMLMPLAERGINLSKIESRPSKKRPWDYYFFLDVTGHYEDAAMKAAVSELKKFCPLVKWLGSYPAVS